MTRDCMISVHPPFPEKKWRENDGIDKEDVQIYLWGWYTGKMVRAAADDKCIGALLDRNVGA